MTNTQAELREKFSKQHEKWLIGTCDDAEAAQEWVMENLPSLLALLPPAPAVGELTDEMLRDRISELEGALEPFANVAQKVLEQTDDHWDAYVTLNGMGNIDSFHRDVFRNASRALGGGHE